MVERFVTLFVAEPNDLDRASPRTSAIDGQPSIATCEEELDLMDRLTRVKSVIESSRVQDPASPEVSSQVTMGANSSTSIKDSSPSEPRTITDLNNWRDPVKSFTTASPEKPSRTSPATIASSVDFPHLPNLIVQGSPRVLTRGRTSLARFSKLPSITVASPDSVVEELAESASNGKPFVRPCLWIGSRVATQVLADGYLTYLVIFKINCDKYWLLRLPTQTLDAYMQWK